MSDEYTDGTEQLKPPRDGEINQIPDVSEGDELVVTAKYNHEPDRTLTVEDLDPDHNKDGSILLSGYGKEYLLEPSTGINFRRVYLRWQTTPEGAPVSDIEVQPVQTETHRTEEHND